MKITLKMSQKGQDEKEPYYNRRLWDITRRKLHATDCISTRYARRPWNHNDVNNSLSEDLLQNYYFSNNVFKPWSFAHRRRCNIEPHLTWPCVIEVVCGQERKTSSNIPRWIEGRCRHRDWTPNVGYSRPRALDSWNHNSIRPQWRTWMIQ